MAKKLPGGKKIPGGEVNRGVQSSIRDFYPSKLNGALEIMFLELRWWVDEVESELIRKTPARPRCSGQSSRRLEFHSGRFSSHQLFRQDTVLQSQP